MVFTNPLALSTLNGTNGFVLNGVDAFDYSGFSVSGAGDINGDGIDDLIIGAIIADPNGQDNAGESYVVFGNAGGFKANVELSELNGNNGFVIAGVNQGDRSGLSVSDAGDVNGDGIDDVIIGADNADPNNNNNAGSSYVVFGSANGFTNQLDLSTLNGNNGFVIEGVNSNDLSGSSVSSAGDVNGDGIDDVIIGARNADPNNNSNAGASYVVFGSANGFDANVELSDLDGNNGFVIAGVNQSDLSGFSVSSAGDVNGDGIDDLIIGARNADPNNNSNAGESYVVFGSANGFTNQLDLSTLNGNNGFVIEGVNSGDLSGSSVSSAGDVNGDGIDDIIIGARNADPNNNSNAGASYVVFGSTTNFSANLELADLDGNNGFVIEGVSSGDRSGFSVSSAGDVNGDGRDDLIIGANNADPNNNSNAGESYVVFGTNTGFDNQLELAELDGNNGLVIQGINPNDYSGSSVSSAGDLNGDGLDDLIIGTDNTNPNSNAGTSFVVFGNANGFADQLALTSLNGTNGLAINGVDADGNSDISVSSAGDINGDLIDDLIIGVSAADPNGRDNAGQSFVVFGNADGFAANLELTSLNGTNGFVINGVDAGDFAGLSVSGAGDINGDGVDDLIIGSDNANPNNNSNAGESYVVFGVRTRPEITTTNTVSILENTTTVIDITATDNENSEGAGLTYAIAGGADQALFSIASTTGVLSFTTAPDFENPGDQEADNNYQVQVQVTDSDGLSDLQNLTISVQDEAPTLDALDLNINRFQNSDLPGTFLFAGEDESRSIRANFPQFVEEGTAFRVADEAGEGLIPIFRFQSINTLKTEDRNQPLTSFISNSKGSTLLNKLREISTDRSAFIFASKEKCPWEITVLKTINIEIQSIQSWCFILNRNCEVLQIAKPI